MVKVIMGLKGHGKTKQLIELVRRASEEEHGNVVCIERDEALRYDIPMSVRLIKLSDYKLIGYTALKGFLSGLRAGNYPHLPGRPLQAGGHRVPQRGRGVFGLVRQLLRAGGREVHHDHQCRRGRRHRGHQEVLLRSV